MASFALVFCSVFVGDFVSFMCVCVSLMCRDKEDEFGCHRRYRRSGDSGDCWSGFDWVLPYQKQEEKSRR